MTARAQTYQGQDAGFTVVELLISITLLAFLSLVLFNALHFGTRIWDAVEKKQSSGNAIRSLQARLASMLERSYPMPADQGTERAEIAFDGEPERVSFVAANAEGWLSRITIRAARDENGNSLFATTIPELADSNFKGNTARLLARNVSYISFHYFGAERSNVKPTWRTTWHEMPALPSLVRIDVKFDDGHTTWPTLVVAPRITADVSCVGPLTSKRCGA